MRIAVVGNCHGGTIAQAIRAALRDVPALDCRHIVSYEQSSEADRAFVEQADRVLAQVTDFKRRDGVAGDLQQRSDRVGLFPLIACNFLYPYAGKPHPLAASTRSAYCPSGYYEEQLSDSNLIRLMEAHRDEPVEAIVERYLALDYAGMIDLDRLYDMNRMKMERIGAAAGLDLWRKVARGFRDAPMFWTYLHPNGALMRDLCRHGLRELRLGLGRDAIDAGLAGIKEPFGFAHTPLHPSIVRHFGIEWADPDYRYIAMPEGAFTAHEFACRFVRFDHDDTLTRAIFDLHSGNDVDGAVAVLEQARARRPTAAMIIQNLAFGYWKQGRLHNSMEATVTALEIDPTQHEWVSFLCLVARQAGLPAPTPPA